MRPVIGFYIALALMLFGFGAAGPTAGAPWAVVIGSFGLFATLAALAASIDHQTRSEAARRARRA